MSRREEILAAAEHAFLKYGIEKITLEDIARECGVKKTALYYYFKNKEEILVEMLKQKMTQMTDIVSEEVFKKNNVKERLRTYMQTKIRIMQENLPFINLFDNETLPLKAKKFLKNHEMRIFDADFCLVKDILKQGIKSKSVSHKLDDSLVLMIMGVTYGTFIGRFMENADWDTDAMIETSIEVIFNGIE
jgi:AcrR family transcriptional regulator